jgi:hypothetical protein
MRRTRYSALNIFLLFAGGLGCLIIAFISVMTAGFGADPVHDLPSRALAFLLYFWLLSIPAYLIMFFWSKVGSVAMWTIAGLSVGILLLIPRDWHYLGLTVPLGIEAFIFHVIDSGSSPRERDVTRK